MCGGAKCGSLVEVRRCPDAAPCLFTAPQAVRTTFVLSGVDADAYNANTDVIKAAVKGFFRTEVFGQGGRSKQTTPLSNQESARGH